MHCPFCQTTCFGWGLIFETVALRFNWNRAARSFLISSHKMSHKAVSFHQRCHMGSSGMTFESLILWFKTWFKKCWKTLSWLGLLHQWPNYLVQKAWVFYPINKVLSIYHFKHFCSHLTFFMAKSTTVTVLEKCHFYMTHL